MTRSDKEDYFRDKFIDAIVANRASIEDMIALARRFDDNEFKNIFERWARLGRELFLVKNVGFINVHVRSEPPGFWGVTKNVIKDFNAFKKHLLTPCWFVLLVGQENGIEQDGYILEDIFSPPMIESPSEQAEAYKINERNLDPSKIIHTTDKVVKRLIELGALEAAKSKKVIIRKRVHNSNTSPTNQ